MEQNNRGQAALEFLLTYSWAILVVIVIIGALAYFGVLNPQNFIPEKCTFSAGISCTDYVYSGDELTIRIVNGLGQGIQIKNMTLDSADLTPGATCVPVNSTGDAIGGATTNDLNLRNGESHDVTFQTCAVQPGTSKMRGVVSIQYVFSGGLTVPKTITGEVFVNTE